MSEPELPPLPRASGSAPPRKPLPSKPPEDAPEGGQQVSAAVAARPAPIQRASSAGVAVVAAADPESPVIAADARPRPPSGLQGRPGGVAPSPPPATAAKTALRQSGAGKFSEAQLQAAGTSPLLQRAAAQPPPPRLPGSPAMSPLKRGSDAVKQLRKSVGALDQSSEIQLPPPPLPPLLPEGPPPVPVESQLLARPVALSDQTDSSSGAGSPREDSSSRSSSAGALDHTMAWKGATTRSSGSRHAGGPPAVTMARARGSTQMVQSEPVPAAVRTVAYDDASSSSPLTSPLSPDSGRRGVDSDGGETQVTASAADAGRRWSFLAAEEEVVTEPDNAQCYVWGVVGRQVRSQPKVPKLDALGEANVKRVVGGSDHFVLLTDTGLVFTWGNGSQGALGHGDTMPRLTPMQVEGLANQHVICIAAARHHSAAITERGQLLNWGTIGVPGLEMCTVPRARSELKGNLIEEVALGDAHVLAVVRGGNVIAWGDNAQGQVGAGSPNNVFVNPVLFSLEEKVSHVYCGSDVSAAVTLRNNAFMWGANWAKPAKPHRVPQRLVVKCKVQSMALGYRHALLLSQEGRVYVMGDNNRYQLGLPSADEHRPSFVLLPMSDGMDDDTPNAPAVDGGPSRDSGGPHLPANGRPASQVIPQQKSFRLNKLVTHLRKPGKPGPGGSGAGGSGGGAGSGGGGSGGGSGGSGGSGSGGSGGAGSASGSSGQGAGGSAASSSESSDFIQVKQIAAGATHSAVLTTGGKVYEFGQMTSVLDASKESRTQLKPTPIIVEALDGVSIDSLACSGNAVLAVVGLKNERELKFLSFNPPVIKAASLSRLVDWLIRESRAPTDTFDYHFFLTLHTFTSPEEIMSKLLSRMREPDASSQLSVRIVGIVYKWMRKRPKDFFDDGVQEMAKQMVNMATDLKAAISKELSKLSTLKEQLRVARPSRSESQGDASMSFDLLKFEPSVVAEQLTLIEEGLIAELDWRELLQNAWSKSDKDVRAPNVLRIIANFNRVSYFVTTHVVSGATQAERTQRSQFWGDVLKHCFSLNNLNTCMAISSAFQSVPFHRLLKRELVEIKVTAQRTLEQVAALMRGNKAGYRRKMEAFLGSGEPAIPYLAVHLSDLTFLEDGNPNYIEDLINMQKRHLIGKQLGPLEKLQSRPYTTFVKNPKLRPFLMRMEGYQETALDHLVEKLIAEEALAAGGRAGAGDAIGPSFRSLSNRSDQVQMLEHEAQASAETRTQVWKEWLLRFSERGAEFLQTWRSSHAWELSLQSLMEHPPGKRDLELFVDVMCKMMPAVAPFLPAAVSAALDCGRTDPSAEAQERVIATLLPYKSPHLDAKADSLSSPRRRDAADVRAENHADVIAGLRKDRRRLPRVQMALLTAPPTVAPEAGEEMVQMFVQRIPVAEEAIRSRAVLQHQIVAEEQAAGVRIAGELTAQDERLEGLLSREQQLKLELEEVQKQIAETQTMRKDLAKEADHQLSSISMRKRIIDTELVERHRLVELLKVASASWERFMGTAHVEYIRCAEEAHGVAQEWVQSRLERLYALLEMHRENLERAGAELATRGGKSLLAAEAWKVASEEATQFLQEASQFLAAFPTALHELHARMLDDIVVLRDEVQLATERHGSGAAPTRTSAAALPEYIGAVDAVAPAEEKFVLPSQRLVLGPAQPPQPRAAGAFVLPSDRFTSSKNL